VTVDRFAGRPDLFMNQKPVVSRLLIHKEK
jgi:hypothetical protein